MSRGDSSGLLPWREKCVESHCAARTAWKTAFSPGRGSTFELQRPVNVYSETQWIKINSFCTGDHKDRLDCFKKSPNPTNQQKPPHTAFQGCLTMLSVLTAAVRSGLTFWASFNVQQHLKLILLKNTVPRITALSVRVQWSCEMCLMLRCSQNTHV